MINLIPPELLQKRKSQSVAYKFITLYIVVFSAVALGVGGLFFYSTEIANQINDRNAELTNLKDQKQKASDVTKKAAFVEDRMKLATTSKEDKDWTALTETIGSVTPTDTQISALKITAPKDATSPFAISITGNSKDRRSIILFRDKLSSTKGFTDSFLTSIADKVDLNNLYVFNLTVNYKQDAK